MNELNLPPYRDMPEHVEANLIRRVQDATTRNVRTRRSSRFAPTLAAAAVVALGGGAIVAGNLSGDPDMDPAPRYAAELDRCWSAIEHEGKADEYPHRDSWRVIDAWSRGQNGFASRMRGDNELLVIRGENRPVFCALTPTTVTVAPAEVPSDTGPGGIRPMLMMPRGPVAGVAETQDEFFLVLQARGKDGNRGGGSVVPTKARAGTFMQSSATPWEDGRPPELGLSYNPDDQEAELNRPLGEPMYDVELPHPPEPAVRHVDHPELVGERTSKRGKVLEQCLAQTAIPGEDAYQPGAMVDTKYGPHVAMRSGNHIGLCYPIIGSDEPLAELGAARGLADQDDPVVLHLVRDAGDNFGDGPPNEKGETAMTHPNPVFVGSVAPGVARLELGTKQDTQRAIDIYEGTFIASVRLDKVLAGPVDDVEIPARAFDDNGTLVWEGTLKVD